MKSLLLILGTLLLTACNASYHYSPRPAPYPHPGYGHGGHHGGGWHHGPGRGHHWLGDKIQLNGAALLALDYGIEQSSAEKITAFASNVQDEQSIRDLGLTQDEVASMSRFEMPSQETIGKIAHTLGESDEAVKNIVADFLEDVKN